MDRPGPPGAAWTHYRARPGLRDRLAAMIAQRAGGNFLVAAMAAVPLSAEPGVIDPAATGFDPAGIPSGVGEALHKYLDRLPGRRRERDRGLLTALAYARGAGLDDPAWLAFAAALGYSATVADLDVLRRSPAADYLLQTTSAERGARPVTRLFHQALTDELLAARHQLLSDESVLLDMLLGQAERCGLAGPLPARARGRARRRRRTGSISSWRIRTTCSASIRPGWCPTWTPHDPRQRTPPPPSTGKAPTSSLPSTGRRGPASSN